MIKQDNPGTIQVTGTHLTKLQAMLDYEGLTIEQFTERWIDESYQSLQDALAAEERSEMVV